MRLVASTILALSLFLILSCSPSDESAARTEANPDAYTSQSPGTDADGATMNDRESEAVTIEYFVFLYTRDTGWVDGTPAFEQPFLHGHFEHMTRLENEGTLVTGGPFKDASGVMGVLKAGSLEEAQQIINDDPMIQNRVFKADVKAWTPSVSGSIEKENP